MPPRPPAARGGRKRRAPSPQRNSRASRTWDDRPGASAGAKSEASHRFLGFLAEIRNGVAQHPVDRAALLALERALEIAEPGAHGLERRTHRAGRHHAGDPDFRDRLLAGEQNLMQALARTDAGEVDLDVAAGLESRQADHTLGKIDDLHRLAHVEYIDRDIRPGGPERVARCRDNEVAGF